MDELVFKDPDGGVGKKSAEHAGLSYGGAEKRRESVVDVSRRQIEACWGRVRTLADF